MGMRGWCKLVLLLLEQHRRWLDLRPIWRSRPSDLGRRSPLLHAFCSRRVSEGRQPLCWLRLLQMTVQHQQWRRTHSFSHSATLGWRCRRSRHNITDDLPSLGDGVTLWGLVQISGMWRYEGSENSGDMEVVFQQYGIYGDETRSTQGCMVHRLVPQGGWMCRLRVGLCKTNRLWGWVSWEQLCRRPSPWLTYTIPMPFTSFLGGCQTSAAISIYMHSLFLNHQ